MSYQYDSDFFDFVNVSSGRSAALFINEFVSRVFDGRAPASVLDVGCGRGVWIAAWASQFKLEIHGLDGDYVDRKSLLIPSESFRSADISKPFTMGRKYDLVECLEVAEHIPEEQADVLIDNLVGHGDLILFSAAIPGQGGEFHVNERPYQYWREKFAARGYSAFDPIRQHVLGKAEIEPWYRYNAFVYANAEGARRMSQAARDTSVPAGRELPDVSPVAWRVRCAVLSSLPPAATSQLARLKHRLANLAR